MYYNLLKVHFYLANHIFCLKTGNDLLSHKKFVKSKEIITQKKTQQDTKFSRILVNQFENGE